MSSQGNGQPSTYQVFMSEQTRARLKQQLREAVESGEGDQFLAAWRAIWDRLRTEPLKFGDPQYHLPALKLLVCQAVMANLVVFYGVHEEKPLVFIRGFKVLP